MSIYGNPVMLGGSSGGGGGGTILSGSGNPPSAQGSNGDIYLQYVASPSIPSGATLLDFVYSPGVEINTGIPCNTASLAVEIDFMSDAGKLSEHGLFGGSWAANGFFFMFYQSKYRFHDGNAVLDINGATAEVYHTIRAEHNVGVTIDGVFHAQTTSGTNVSNPLKLTSKMGYFYGNAAYGRIKGFRAWSGATLLAEYIPVKDTNNVACFYDTVSQSYVYGSGTLTAGNAITPGEIADAYAKVNGVWQSLIGTSINDVTH